MRSKWQSGMCLNIQATLIPGNRSLWNLETATNTCLFRPVCSDKLFLHSKHLNIFPTTNEINVCEPIIIYARTNKYIFTYMTRRSKRPFSTSTLIHWINSNPLNKSSFRERQIFVYSGNIIGQQNFIDQHNSLSRNHCSHPGSPKQSDPENWLFLAHPGNTWINKLIFQVFTYLVITKLFLAQVTLKHNFNTRLIQW